MLEAIGIQREKTCAFALANGQELTRGVGFAIIRVGRHFTTDEVVFAEPGDTSLIGSRSLTGLNFSGGPLLAATPVRR